MDQSGLRRQFPPLGKLEWVERISHPPFTVKTRSRNPKYSRGLKYERKVHARFESLYEEAWLPSPWFCYRTAAEDKRKYCQLDGILSLFGKKILVECKYNHCPDAYFQLTNLYLPVVQFLFPETEFALCEVVKWYDPDTDFPVAVKLLPKLEDARVGDFSVHILNR